jgi:16S rRNA (uracil1498-N3)-methyltransferase
LQRLTVAPTQIDFPVLNLTTEQQHYLRRVLRLQAGDRFLAIDGLGGSYLIELQAESACILEIGQLENRELSLPIHAAIALPKQGFDDVVRACTELGVSHIHPILSDRTIPSPSASRQQRWVKIVREAAEQCERTILPQIAEIAPWSEVSAQAQGQKKLCVTRRSAPHLAASLAPQGEIWLAIGPEGGWSDREQQRALDLGWEMVSLGPRILRTITAPIAALAIVGSYLDRSN